MITMSIYEAVMSAVCVMMVPVVIYTVYKMIPMIKKEMEEK